LTFHVVSQAVDFTLLAVFLCELTPFVGGLDTLVVRDDGEAFPSTEGVQPVLGAVDAVDNWVVTSLLAGVVFTGLCTDRWAQHQNTIV